MIKTIYNTDDVVAASEWVREEIKDLKTYDAPQMTSALGIKRQGTSMRGRVVQNAIGYFMLKANKIQENATGIAMCSCCYANGHGLSIIPANFAKVTTLFTARKCIKDNWINSKDEYLEPRHD